MNDIILEEKWKYKRFSDSQISILNAPHPTFGFPWPMPKFWSVNQCFYLFDISKILFNTNMPENNILKTAIDRFKFIVNKRLGISTYPILWKHHEHNLFNQEYLKNVHCNIPGTAANFPQNLSVLIDYNNINKLFQSVKLFPSFQYENKIVHIKISIDQDIAEWPHLEMNESYKLVVSNEFVIIKSSEVWGALRALETLNQILWTTLDKKSLFINQTYINDVPRFKHRGLMIDTSRHFISKAILLLNLEAMAYNKMNVFHWHITDDNSFPYQSIALPKLQNAAYHKTKTYSQTDIKEIVEFARLRGIRVIPEIDMPGHSFSLRQSYPELLSKCYSHQKWDGFYGPLNPVSNLTYEYIETLLREIFTLFPDSYVHLGGDEVQNDCWFSNPEIMTMADKLDFLGKNTLMEYFWQRVQNIVKKLGKESNIHFKNKKLILWEDSSFLNINFDKSLITQIWKNHMDSFFNTGYNIIYSTCWYLDNLQDINSWNKYYLCEPSREIFDDDNMLLVGGEACMWTEFQSDLTISTRIWPVTIAIAERFWSPKHVNDLATVGPRIEEQRCRLISRGIPVGVLLGPGSCDSLTYLEYKTPNNVTTNASINTTINTDSQSTIGDKYRLFVTLLAGFVLGVLCNALYYHLARKKLHTFKVKQSTSLLFYFALVCVLLVQLKVIFSPNQTELKIK